MRSRGERLSGTRRLTGAADTGRVPRMTNPISPKTLFTRAEAADLCEVSLDTIKRALRDDRYPNADASSGR